MIRIPKAKVEFPHLLIRRLQGSMESLSLMDESFQILIFTQSHLLQVGNSDSFSLYWLHSLNSVSIFADAPRREIYFLAVIDVLTHYGVKKQAAKAAKTVKYGSNVEGISTCEPDQYAKRFLDFIQKAIE